MDLNNSLNKIESYIGFAIKARKVGWGVDNIVAKREKPYLILTDSSLSTGSKRKLANYASTHNIDISELEELTSIIGRGAKAIGVNEPNLAAAINKVMKGV